MDTKRKVAEDFFALVHGRGKRSPQKIPVSQRALLSAIRNGDTKLIKFLRKNAALSGLLKPKQFDAIWENMANGESRVTFANLFDFLRHARIRATPKSPTKLKEISSPDDPLSPGRRSPTSSQPFPSPHFGSSLLGNAVHTFSHPQLPHSYPHMQLHQSSDHLFGNQQHLAPQISPVHFPQQMNEPKDRASMVVHSAHICNQNAVNWLRKRRDNSSKTLPQNQSDNSAEQELIEAEVLIGNMMRCVEDLVQEVDSCRKTSHRAHEEFNALQKKLQDEHAEAIKRMKEKNAQIRKESLRFLQSAKDSLKLK